MKIFVVDHDARLRNVIARELKAVDYDVLSFANGKDAYEAIDKGEVDLVILDPALPDMDGSKLIRRIRTKPGVGIIVLTSASHVADRIIGLEIGADDYMAKPCHMRELVARVRTVLRRVRHRARHEEFTSAASAYEFDGWRLNTSNFTVTRPDGRQVALTTGDFRILEFLVTHPNRYWDARELLRVMPATRAANSASAVMTAIKRLRHRLGDSARDPRLIGTLRGSGYKFLPKVAKVESALEQAATGTQEVTTNISGVSQAANDTGSAATQVLSSARELSDQSENLKKVVTSFLANVKAA